MSTVYQHLYRRLAHLIPLDQCGDGRLFAAQRGLHTVYCHVTRAEDGACTVEIAHDEVVSGLSMPVPTVTLRADCGAQTAEVLVYEDPWRFEVVYGDRGVNPRRAAINLYVVNWLQHMLNLHVALQPIEQPAAA